MVAVGEADQVLQRRMDDFLRVRQDGYDISDEAKKICLTSGLALHGAKCVHHLAGNDAQS